MELLAFPIYLFFFCTLKNLIYPYIPLYTLIYPYILSLKNLTLFLRWCPLNFTQNISLLSVLMWQGWFETKMWGKGKFGTDRRHKRGGMRQKSVKMCVFGTDNQRCTCDSPRITMEPCPLPFTMGNSSLDSQERMSSDIVNSTSPMNVWASWMNMRGKNDCSRKSLPWREKTAGLPHHQCSHHQNFCSERPWPPSSACTRKSSQSGKAQT